MNAEKHGLKHEGVSEKIIAAFFEAYNELGHGFLESVYEAAMELLLKRRGLTVLRQYPIAVYFRGELIGEFRADLFVEDCVIAELKAAKAIDPAHQAQLLNYLKATTVEVGLLLNFGVKPEFKRLVFDNDRKTPQASQSGSDSSANPICVDPCSSAARFTPAEGT